MLSNWGLEHNSNQLNFVQDDLFIKCHDVIHNVMQPILAFVALLNFGSMQVEPLLDWLSGRVLDCKVGRSQVPFPGLDQNGYEN